MIAEQQKLVETAKDAPVTPAAPPAGIDIAKTIADALSAVVRQTNPRLRENPDYTPDSVYHPRGTVKTPWARRYFFAGIEQEWAMCLPEEADLFERLTAGNYHFVDGTARWIVDVRGTGPSTEVHVKVPCSDADARSSLPSLRRILREIVLGEPAD